MTIVRLVAKKLIRIVENVMFVNCNKWLREVLNIRDAATSFARPPPSDDGGGPL